MKPLTRAIPILYHVYNGRIIEGPHDHLRGGDLSKLWGDCSNMWGIDCYLSEDCSHLSGNYSGMRGKATDLSGNLDNLPDDERRRHSDLDYWVKDPESEEPKPLTRIIHTLYHTEKGGRMIEGPHSLLKGNCSNMWGNCSRLRGWCSPEIYDDWSGLSGDLTGLRGKGFGLSGNLDDIPSQERLRHPDLAYWVKETVLLRPEEERMPFFRQPLLLRRGQSGNQDDIPLRGHVNHANPDDWSRKEKPVTAKPADDRIFFFLQPPLSRRGWVPPSR